jgi:hypothetical protein
MSNIVPFTTNIPAHLANRVGQPSALAQALAGGISSSESFPRISIKGARFRIIEGGVETVLNSTTLDVVIVGANPHLSKAWYAKEWSKDAEPSAPDCFSLDGIKPNVDAVDPQNDMCAGCPQNAWGSKVTSAGQQIKACSDKKRLAVVAADDAGGPVYLLEVTPAALKGLNFYQKELSMRGIAPEIVRTRVSFDTEASFPKLQFGFGGFLEEDAMNAVDAIAGSENILEITGQKSTGTAAPMPVAAPKPQLVKPAAKPAPEPEVVEEEVAAPKRGFGATKAAPAAVAKPAAKPAAKPTASASSLADEIAMLVDEMADDA